MTQPTKIVVLDVALPGDAASPSPETILAGIPHARAATQYVDGGGEFSCGVWTSTPGKWRVRYTEHEFCVIIEGRVRLESATGERREFGAGAAFVVPAGFEGSWEVLAPCRKWYAVFEPKPTRKP
ncbi:MAG TPA: cupin domain-containing protein [Steroidobacteraceae bacterium]|nr:cupin domain-containing protein [Steroidobacteraceae bacterium]